MAAVHNDAAAQDSSATGPTRSTGRDSSRSLLILASSRAGAMNRAPTKKPEKVPLVLRLTGLNASAPQRVPAAFAAASTERTVLELSYDATRSRPWRLASYSALSAFASSSRRS